MSRDYNGGWEFGLGEKAFRGFLDFDGFLRIYVEKFNYIKTPETEYINQNFITPSDIFQNINLYIKKFRIWSFSGPHFPTFELNKERYSFSFRIQPECGNIRTRKTPNTDIFHKLWIMIENIIIENISGWEIVVTLTSFRFLCFLVYFQRRLVSRTDSDALDFCS